MKPVHLERLQAARKRSGRTQPDFAALVGMSVESYRRREQGSTSTTVDELERFNEALGLDPRFFFDSSFPYQLARPEEHPSADAVEMGRAVEADLELRKLVELLLEEPAGTLEKVAAFAEFTAERRRTKKAELIISRRNV